MRSLVIGSLVLLVLLFVSPLSMLAANSAQTSSTGQFTVNNSPTSVSFTLYQSDETTQTKTMAPQVEFALKITISDLNSLQDIASITVILFYDTNASSVGTPPTSDDPATRATYKWDPTNGWQLVGPTGSTWGINLTASKAPANLSQTTGDWWLHFIPGKVAHEADGTNDDWDIIVQVTDTSGNTYEASDFGYTMLWYGEISISTTTIDFGAGLPGDQLGPQSYNLTLIANGNYSVQTMADAQWTTSAGQTANLDTDGTLSLGEFQLATDDDSTYDPPNDTMLVTNTYATIPGHSQDPGPTTETGTVLTLYSWLTIGNGLLPGTYTGKIYFQIVNA